MAGIEIFSGASIAFLLYFIFQSLKKQKTAPNFIHWSGFEIPLLILLSLVSIGLVLHNDYNPDRMREFGNIRWVVVFFAILYSMVQVQWENKDEWARIFFLMCLMIGIYAFCQAVTGIDLVRWDNRAVQFDHYDKFPFYRAAGFFSNPMTFGHSSAMWGVICFSFFIVQRRDWRKCLMPAIGLFGVVLGLYCSHTRGAWIAFFFGSLFIATLKNFKVGLLFVFSSFLLAGIAALVFPPFAERLHTIFDPNFTSNVSRMYIWKAHFEIFKDYPWMGAGLNYNPYLLGTYYDKLVTPTTYKQIGHAHNTYLQWLAGTGVLGLVAYMLFIVKGLWISLKEYLWSKKEGSPMMTSILLGCLGAQVAFHFGGLTECNFRDAEVRTFFLVMMAIPCAHGIQRRFLKIEELI